MTLDHIDLFGKRKLTDDQVELAKRRLKKEIAALDIQLEEYKSSAIYRDAFEWRFEFPEVLNDEGDYLGFDVVIGNPPYGISINRKDNPEYSRYYSEILLGEVETFILFYYRGLKLLNPKGTLGYITPDSWLTNSSASAFRNWLQKTYDIYDVYDYYKPFADAKDTRCHSILVDKLDSSPLIRIKQVLPADKETVYRDFRINQNVIKSFKENQWRLYVTDTERILFDKMEKVSVSLETNYNLKYGLRTGDNKKYVTERETKYPSIAGADIASLYGIKWHPKYLIHVEELSQGYFNDYYSDKKVIIQRIRTNSLNLNARWLESAYVEGNYIPNDSLSYVYSKKSEFSLLYLIALLNSKLMNKYYRSYYTDVNVKPTYLAQLPIPEIKSKQQLPFITLVDKILTIKKSNPVADTTALEEKIDKLVFDLYGLTDEERKIVIGG